MQFRRHPTLDSRHALPYNPANDAAVRALHAGGFGLLPGAVHNAVEQVYNAWTRKTVSLDEFEDYARTADPVAF